MTLARLAVACLLFLALLRMPYAYYQLLRWAVCAVAAWSAYAEFERDTDSAHVWTVLFVGVAILFNPFAPIYLGRRGWGPVDIATGCFFVASVVAGAWKAARVVAVEARAAAED